MDSKPTSYIEEIKVLLDLQKEIKLLKELIEKAIKQTKNLIEQHKEC